MYIYLFIVFTFVLPRLLIGNNPILIAVGASLVIIPVSFYLAHGFNKKTTIAIISSIISLIITAALASIFYSNRPFNRIIIRRGGNAVH